MPIIVCPIAKPPAVTAVTVRVVAEIEPITDAATGFNLSSPAVIFVVPVYVSPGLANIRAPAPDPILVIFLLVPVIGASIVRLPEPSTIILLSEAVSAISVAAITAVVDLIIND